MTEQQLVISMRDPCEQSEAAPDEYANTNNVFARETITQPAHAGASNHVREEKGAGKQPDLCVGNVEFILYQGLNRE